MFSALTSQIISNVPSTLLFSNFTDNWQDLLWGVNAGGFGSLFASFANLIAYRLYLNNTETGNPGKFTIQFMIFGYIFFFISFGLFFVLRS
jgi:Na+/H+ antiporter NhaD/arsenite permease-like protein